MRKGETVTPARPAREEDESAQVLSPAYERTQEIEENLDSLTGAISMLSSRLDPFCASSDIKGISKGETMPRSPFAGALLDINARVVVLVETVRDLTDRLDI